MSELPWALARPSSKGNPIQDLRRNVNPKYKVDELNEPPPRLPGIRSLLPLPGGDLLTGGTDLRIRRWDHYRFLFYFLGYGEVYSLIRPVCSCCSTPYLCFVVAVLTELTLSVGQTWRESEMMISMKLNLVLVCKLCRYFHFSWVLPHNLWFDHRLSS